MTVETATKVEDLNENYPAVGDLKSEGDDHIRKIKSCLLYTFAGAASTGVTGFNVVTQAAGNSSTLAASTSFVTSALATLTTQNLSAPPAIGNTTPSTGAFTTVTGGLPANLYGGGKGGVLIGGSRSTSPNGVLLALDGAANWVSLQTSKNENPTEFNIYSTSGEGYAVTVDGTNQITKLWGSDFQAAWVGKALYFLGKKYTVASYVSASSITVTEVGGAAVTFVGAITDAYNYFYTSGSGLCNIVGNTVNFVSGDPFVPLFFTDWELTVNGSVVTATTWTDANQYVLSTSPGDATNVAFTWRGNVNDQLSTLRVQAITGAEEENVVFTAIAGNSVLGRHYSLHSGYAGTYGKYRPIFMGGGQYSDYTQKHQVGMYPPDTTAGHYGVATLGGVQGRETLRVYGADASTAYNTFLRIDPAASANAPVGLQAWGGGADVSAFLTGKGAGVVNIGNHKANYLTLVGSDTGSGGYIAARGSDANIDLLFDCPGTGAVKFTGGTFNRFMLHINSTATSTAYLQLGANVGLATVVVAGTATNADLGLYPKGTGNLLIGTASAAASTPASFSATRRIAIKDSTGTVYYIPCSASTW